MPNIHTGLINRFESSKKEKFSTNFFLIIAFECQSIKLKKAMA
jgi:hypothetical protein